MLRIFIERSTSATRLISGRMASSINKICVIGQTAIHTYFMSHHCIPKKLRFGAVFGPAASLGRTSFVMIKTGTTYCEWESLPFNDNRILNDMDLEDMWFQQHGATRHTANVTINLLETKFGNGPVGWPPRSCDLTP